MKLVDSAMDIKVKLAALWISLTLCYLYGDYFELYVPLKVDELIHGTNLLSSPVKLFGAAVLLSIPALMVSVSILAKPIINKVLNIIFGLMFTVIMVLIAFQSLEPWRAFYLFLAILESIISSNIVYLAFSWPKDKESKTPIK